MTLRAVLLVLLASATPAVSQELRFNDAADKARFEQADADLVQAVDGRLTAIARGWSGTSPRIEQAKALFSAAHQDWLRFREAECKAYAAAKSLISARTVIGLNYACLHTLTQKRIAEIKSY